MTDAQMLQTITTMLTGPPSSLVIIMAIGAAARLHGLDGLMYYRQIWAESRFNPEAVNPKSGCLGLGQMNPKFWPEATTDVKGNLKLSAGYMENLLEQYGGNYEKALAAYNWGPARVDFMIDKFAAYGGSWYAVLPQETQKYIRWIMEGDGDE